jgi:hypothetical protein
MAATRRRATRADMMMERELEAGILSILADLPRDPARPGQAIIARYHTYRSERSPSGFPDEVWAGPGGMMLVELKRERERPKPLQEWWLAKLTDAGATAVVRRPSDLLSGLIGRELATLAGMPVAVPPSEVTRLAAVIRRTGAVAAADTENVARAVLRAGYAHSPQPPGSAS